MAKDVLKEDVDKIIGQSFWGKTGVSLNESAKKLSEQAEVEEVEQVEEEVEEVQDEVLEEQAHACPLCESALEEPISDEQLTEHIQMMLGIINEMDNISDEDLEAIEEEILSEVGEESVEDLDQ